MPQNYTRALYIILITLILLACQTGTALTPTIDWSAVQTAAVATAYTQMTAEAMAGTSISKPSATPTDSFLRQDREAAAVKIVTGPPIMDFAWSLDDSQIYYALGHSETDLEWYAFDLTNQNAHQITDPFSPPDLSKRLSTNGTHKVLATSLSPSGTKALYTILSDRPTPKHPAFDSFELTDLWFWSNAGDHRTELITGFSSSCGQLSSKNIWKMNETLIIGTCAPYNGVPVQFITYPEKPLFYLLWFNSASTGNNVISAYQTDVSYDGKWLTFVDLNNKLWLIETSRLEILKQDGLDQTSHLDLDGKAFAPQWSSDGRLYFWLSSGEQQTEKVFSLERYDPNSKRLETVLSGKQLDALTGTDFSKNFVTYRLPGFEAGWSLAPEGNRAIIALGDSPNIQSLWLLTWQK